MTTVLAPVSLSVKKQIYPHLQPFKVGQRDLLKMYMMPMLFELVSVHLWEWMILSYDRNWECEF